MSKIWEKVVQHQGEIFQTVTGLEFTYRVSGEKVIHTRSKATLSKRDFETAVIINPQKAFDLHNSVTGPSYVYAIITDDRIK